MNLSELEVKRIDYQLAMRVVRERHYLHRVCPCSMAFGLCDVDNDVWGVVTYGVPCSSTLLRGICGPDEAHNVYELNRLWVHPEAPRNSASYLVSHSVRMLDKEIFVSFADTSVGHVGYVYQAANFLYCGMSARFTDTKVSGFEGKHHATFAHGMTMSQVIETYGEDAVEWVERPRKHRYVYFNASKKRRKSLMRKLLYEVQTYPKGDSLHTGDCDKPPERFAEQLKIF